VIAGPLRHPRNLEQSIPGSIHEDSTARKLGLRGGTVAGSLHMEQFPPLLVEALGEEWWRTGGLSLYFKYATTGGEDRARMLMMIRTMKAASPLWQ